MARMAGITVFVLLLASVHCCAFAQQVRQGVWAGSAVDVLAFPSSGYQAYLIGELHGLKENVEFELAYLGFLRKHAALRDVAIEEKSVYEEQAQAFVEGEGVLPGELCLRASLLSGIRALNLRLPENERIRVHLIDVDSPPDAIRRHLVQIQQQIQGASGIQIPQAGDIKAHGIDVVRRLEAFQMEPRLRRQLRTIEHSILAYEKGFEVGTGPPKGSPYLEDRESAMAENVEEEIKAAPNRPVLVLCGADHVSRSLRKDGGPDRDKPFLPMAGRLAASGFREYSLVEFPLAGTSSWRGRMTELPWGPGDSRLESGETLDHVLASTPKARYLHIDRSIQRVRLASKDISNDEVDGYLLFPLGTPMKDMCKSEEVRHSAVIR